MYQLPRTFTKSIPKQWIRSCNPLPPGTKPIHAWKKSWGIHFCANACGACIRTRANTEKYFWGAIFLIFPIFGGEFKSVQIHAAPVFPTRANTGKYSWRIIYVLVSCQGVHYKKSFPKMFCDKGHVISFYRTIPGQCEIQKSGFFWSCSA